MFSCLLIFSVSAAKIDIGNAGGFLNQVMEPTGLEKTDVSTASGRLIKNLLRVVGTSFLFLMVYGGFMWMTAQGDEGKIEKARNTIIAAVIGMTVVVGAFGITSFITSRLVQNTQGSAPVDAGAVGDQPLGCCVIDIGATEAYRIDTHVECKRIADGIEAGRPFIWTGNISAPACQRFCE